MELHRTAKLRPFMPESDEVAPEPSQAVFIIPGLAPVNVVPWRVVAVGVVVTILGVSILVTHENHRNSLYTRRCVEIINEYFCALIAYSTRDTEIPCAFFWAKRTRPS